MFFRMCMPCSLLLVSCDRAELQDMRNQLLQNEITQLQERIRELESEASSCHTNQVLSVREQSECEAVIETLTDDLYCARTRLENPADRNALGMGVDDRIWVNFETSLGTIGCELLVDASPRAVQAFVELVRGSVEWTHPVSQVSSMAPLYTDTIFHRVIPDFMIQGGDPAGTGLGGPGFPLPDEFSCSLPFTEPGLLALANQGEEGTAGSQFFITTDAQPSLNGRYTVLGRCENLDIIRQISQVPRDEADRPLEDVALNRAMISVVTESR